jgi:predicted RNA methylase
VSVQLVMPGHPPPPDAALSQFDTPAGLARRLANWAGVYRGMRVLEPSAGLGAIAEAARAHGAVVECVEIAPARVQWLEKALFSVTESDFLATVPGEQFDLALGNPPYEDGQDLEHVLHALRFAPRVCMLLPLGMLDGVDRYRRLWSHFGLRRLAILVRRFQSPGTEHGGQRPFAAFEFTREPQLSTAVEWWA